MTHVSNLVVGVHCFDSQETQRVDMKTLANGPILPPTDDS